MKSFLRLMLTMTLLGLLLASCSKYVHSYQVVAEKKDGSRKYFSVMKRGHFTPALKIKKNTLRFGGMKVEKDVIGLSILEYKRTK